MPERVIYIAWEPQFSIKQVSICLEANWRKHEALGKMTKFKEPEELNRIDQTM